MVTYYTPSFLFCNHLASLRKLDVAFLTLFDRKRGFAFHPIENRLFVCFQGNQSACWRLVSLMKIDTELLMRKEERSWSVLNCRLLTTFLNLCPPAAGETKLILETSTGFDPWGSSQLNSFVATWSTRESKVSYFANFRVLSAFWTFGIKIGSFLASDDSCHYWYYILAANNAFLE